MKAMKRFTGLAAGAAVAFSLAGAANAATDVPTLEFQVRPGIQADPSIYNLWTNANDGEVLDYTGSLDLVYGSGNDNLAFVFIDDSGDLADEDAFVSDISGSFTFDQGNVTGANFSVEVDDGGGNLNTYTADVVSSSGVMRRITGPTGDRAIQFDADTVNGEFSAADFGGVDITSWFENAPLSGDVITFRFSPDSSGFDSQARMNVVTFVPTPAAFAAGLPLLGILGVGYLVRKRRMQA